MKKTNTKKGFTLIELLVVVSIIGLLASVVVAALVDSREGAKNAKRNELARQYVTALGLYFGEYGHYPEQCSDCSSNTELVCLGSGYPGGSCIVQGPHAQNPNINTAISEFMPGTPASLESSLVSGVNFQGINYHCVDEACNNYSITWFVKGTGNDSECFGGAEKTEFLNDVGGWCTYSS